MALRVLFLSDTHLGFDLPLAPRVRRRRRGPDFLANHRRALEPALRGEVDLVVHGGDLFHRARPHPTLVARAFAPLLEVADLGVPVVVVPGNHERSRIPHPRFATHPRVHLFHTPGTVRLEVRGTSVALAGFPYERDAVRASFPRLLAATGWHPGQAEVSLLCMHHCVEGARVGPRDFTFRRGPDVIRCADLPAGMDGVLSGHIHRHQVLTRDLHGRELPVPVLYPGSTERTAFAEMGEEKGYLVLEVGGAPVRWRFHPLPTRPMVEAEVGAGLDAAELERRVARALSTAPGDAVLRLRVSGPLTPAAGRVLAAPRLRSRAPGMNVEVVAAGRLRGRRTRRREPRSAGEQLSLLGAARA